MTDYANPFVGKVVTRANGQDMVCVSVNPPVWAIKKIRPPKITFGVLPHEDAQDMDGWRRPSDQHFHLYEDGEWVDQTPALQVHYIESATEPNNPYPGLRWRNSNYTLLTYTASGVWIED